MTEIFDISYFKDSKGRDAHKGDTAWTPKYEDSVSEVGAFILKQRRHAMVLTYELINRLAVA
jgi:hypothetical protein